jgi:hypothetical protein
MSEISCVQYAEGMQQWITFIVCIHIMCFIINIFREIYETQLGSIGRIMRAIEVMGLGGYGVLMIQSLWFISITDYWNRLSHVDPNLNVRQCFINRDKLFEMTGTTTSFA